MEQDPIKCRGPGFVPPVARLADVSKVMGFHDGPAACRLSVQRRHKLLKRLVGAPIPAAIPGVAPWLGDRAAFEAPLQPPQLVMGNMLEQLDRRPAGRQPTAAQLAARQGFKLAHQPGPKIIEVPEEDLARDDTAMAGSGNGRLTKEGCRTSLDPARSAPNTCPPRRFSAPAA